MSDLDVGIVAVRIFWLPSPHSPAAHARQTSGKDLQHGPIVVHRTMSCGPVGVSGEDLPVPEWPDNVEFGAFGVGMPGTEGGRAGDTREHYFQDAFDDYVAKKLVGPAWKKSSEVWVTPVCEDMASVADRISDVHDQWHDLILGKPVQYVAGQTPLTDIATELPLLGDTWFAGIKRLVQISGILFGLTSGQPLLVNACLKSLAHDVLLKVVSKEIGYLLTDTLEPAGSRERDLGTPKAKDERARQTTQLTELLGITRQDQRKSEESMSDETKDPGGDYGNYGQQTNPDLDDPIVGGQGIHSDPDDDSRDDYGSEQEK